MIKAMAIKVAEQLRDLLPPEAIVENAPMAEQTTFKIGGPADVLVFPGNMEEVQQVVTLCQQQQVPFTVLGNGSNVLVTDKGIRGVVLKFGKRFNYIKQQGNAVVAGAGALLKQVANFAMEAQLTGVEPLAGIPGSVGGAVYMNAGAYDKDMSQVVTAAQAIDIEGNITRYTNGELDFGYRTSVFHSRHLVVLEAEFALLPGDREDITAKMNDYQHRRKSKQPLHMPSAGSMFKRPPGYFAGKLIEDAGLKGMRMGGAEISEMHAGFIVNAGDATAEDVLGLIKHVQQKIYAESGVRLETEVRVIGEK